MIIKDTLTSIDDIREFDKHFLVEHFQPGLVSKQRGTINEKRIQNHESQLRLFAYYNHELIGILMARPNHFIHQQLAPFNRYLSDLFVRPDRQKHPDFRVGTQLISELYRRVSGCSILVQAVNHSGGFYKKQGFEYINTLEDAIFYGKKIKEI
ncbi:MAG TPA: GNAT family N-acetyltransferase [Candidatus Absconditabacterales bacterium]|nr:GNAT family N-acetyltransferase [Candidatus Absconditabacterales bacterium]HNG97674.1 GNAT family N-acetyltransferase [Candidatus Absconditabacterales bacterium]